MNPKSAYKIWQKARELNLSDAEFKEHLKKNGIILSPEDWNDIRVVQPEAGKEVLFLTTDDRSTYTGVFFPNKDLSNENFIGWFKIRSGIGFNIWKSNKQEVTHWAEIAIPPMDNI